MMTVLAANPNPVEIRGGVLRVDRKFHSGMLRFCEELGSVVCVNPTLRRGQIMDPIEVPVSDLPYTQYSIDSTFDPWIAAPHEVGQLRELIKDSDLVYGCSLSAPQLAFELRVPYVLIAEYDLPTKLQIVAAEAKGLRRLVRSARCLRDHYLREVQIVKRAAGVHCNGYPIFDAIEGLNENRLLYFDSRISCEQIISEAALHKRLGRIGPLRLIYSGRYERLKGADDVMRVALGCLEAGLDITLDCYGQGSLRGLMESLATPHEQIRVHGPVPYPELVSLSKDCDAFLCCHIQGDPSCTYLEAMGCGLPVIGYGNRMWSRMCRESRAGFVCEVGDIGAMVEAVGSIPGVLAEMSREARAFAEARCFEKEFSKRIAGLEQITPSVQIVR